MQLTGEEEQIDGHRGGERELEGGRGHADGTEPGVRGDEAEALADAVAEAGGAGRVRRRSALGKRGPVLEGRCLPLRQRGAAPGHGFVRRIRRRDANDTAKNSAPKATAAGAGSVDTSAPPSAGAPICAADRLPSSALLPWTS
ncbi:hypothetical protein SCALM49S_02591 [Streptomyces californicus]